MLCKPKISARRKRIRRVIYIILAGILVLSVYLEFAVKSQLEDAMAAQMKTLAQRAMNSAVAQFIAENPDIGERLSEPHYGEDGMVTSVTSNPTDINYLKATVATLSQDKIEALCADEGVSVPLGSFTGFVLFRNLGPYVRLEIGSRQTVICSLKSTFEGAGMNQTLHHVILTVEADIVVYNPFNIHRALHTSADFEIAQTVIVGSVPNYSGVLTY